jgi:phosphatidylethanolamine-binding protein (PEBP) family uncharacterized protein
VQVPADDDDGCATSGDNENVPDIEAAFRPFAASLQLRRDADYFYVGSNGLPDHRLMKGIRAWQQQVPLAQKYFGDNAWRIPLHPVPAQVPASAKNGFLRGAIALAVNGVPIFNPLNNRGDDAYLFGELDEFGGHCGRADDYHYHLAPVHLEKQTGPGQPIAYALDGYPIYGYTEPDGSPVLGLDALNGHRDAAGNYHYHATKSYPYLNGGFYGEVVERDGQVDPQPRAEPIRPALPPLRGATITDFKQLPDDAYELKYDLDGRAGYVRYKPAGDGSVAFTFVDTAGRTTNETYQPGRRPRDGNAGPPDRRPPPRRDDRRLPPRNAGPAADATRSNLPQLTVTSSAIGADGRLPAEFTCDGAGVSPPLAWSNVPQGTKCFAVSLWHTAPDREKSYWLVYDVPAAVTRLEKNSSTVGRIGLNDRRRAEYDPMCSKGPGIKTYHVTVYALSTQPNFAAGPPARAELLAAIKNITVAEGTLTFQYERP